MVLSFSRGSLATKTYGEYKHNVSKVTIIYYSHELLVASGLRGVLRVTVGVAFTKSSQHVVELILPAEVGERDTPARGVLHQPLGSVIDVEIIFSSCLQLL